MSNETRRILLVEDEKAIRDAVTAYLERENYWVTAVGDGQEALEEFSKHHFDLVILDLMLPRVPGERVCRAIRDNSDVPIIMLTAKGEVVRPACIGLELGADDYLAKPFSPRELRGARPVPCCAACTTDSELAARGFAPGVRRARPSTCRAIKVLVNGEADRPARPSEIEAAHRRWRDNPGTRLLAHGAWCRSVLGLRLPRRRRAPSTATSSASARSSATTRAARSWDMHDRAAAWATASKTRPKSSSKHRVSASSVIA